jgi:hypothetical protein
MSLTINKPRRFRLQRSELAVPATSPHFFPKAARGDADVIFLDLEDAVAPEQKVRARDNAIAALNEVDWGTKTVAVRINGLDTPWAFRDILDIGLQCPRLDMFMLPKVGTAFDVQYVDTLLTQIEQDVKRREPFGLEILIETALGMANVEAIAASSERLEAMIFGVGDYSVSMQTGDVLFGSAAAKYSILTAPNERGERERHWNDKWHFALLSRTRHLRVILRRMLNIENSLAERGEFELPVPICEQSEESPRVIGQFPRRVPKGIGQKNAEPRGDLEPNFRRGPLSLRSHHRTTARARSGSFRG